MCRKFYVFFIFISLNLELLSQSKFSLESTIGFQLLDYISDELDSRKTYKSFALHSSLLILNEYKFAEKFESRCGIGYARFDYTTSKDYIEVKYGVNYNLSEKIKLTLS